MLSPTEPLDRQAEIDLIVDHQCGSPTAIETLLRANARWLSGWADRYTGVYVPHEDLFQAGCVAFIEAANKYVPQDGVGFRGFAQYYIRREMTATVAAYYPGLSMSRQAFDLHGLTEMGTLVDAGTLEDIAGIEPRYIERDLITQMLRSLPKRQRQALVMSFGLAGEPMDDASIAQYMGVTRTVVTKLRKKALAQLRESFTDHGESIR